MAKELNTLALKNIKDLISQGSVDKVSEWSFSFSDVVGEGGESSDKAANAHLGIDSENHQFCYPVAKLVDGELVVFRSGVLDAKQKAKENGDKYIENAVDGLLQKLSEEKEEFADKLLDLEGVEVFRKGIWNGKKFTDADLDEILENFNKVGFRPPVKMGHTKDPGARAFGWVKSLKRQGDKLIAGFRDMPSRVIDAIKEKGFDSVSVELIPNLERNGKKFGKTLAGVALLGAEIPAVDGLKPVSESLKFDKDDNIEEITLKEENSMTEEEIQKLQEEKERLENELDELKKGQEQNSQVSEDLQETKKQLAQIKEDRRQERVESFASSVEIPSLRPFVQVFADWATLADTTELYKFEENGNTVERSAEDVIKSFVDHINNSSQWLFSTQTKGGDDRQSSELNAGDRLDEMAQQRMKQNSEDYATAFDTVLSENPQLAKEYASS